MLNISYNLCKHGLMDLFYSPSGKREGLRSRRFEVTLVTNEFGY